MAPPSTSVLGPHGAGADDLQRGQAGNHALISLVQASISFLAGQIAKTGVMRVDTPVTTMGIRGQAPPCSWTSLPPIGRVLFR